MNNEELREIALSILERQVEKKLREMDEMPDYEQEARPKRFALEDFLKNCPRKMRSWRCCPP